MEQVYVIIEKAENNYSAYLEGIDGIIGTGDTISEVKDSIKKSIELLKEECDENKEIEMPEELSGDYELKFFCDFDDTIEQACEWLRENFNQVLRKFDDGEIVNKLFTEDIEDRFKQAMEE